MFAQASRITVFPIKSCDACQKFENEVLPGGALRHDRQFALVDSTRRIINAKRTPSIHRIRLVIDPVRRDFEIGLNDSEIELHGNLDRNADQLSNWLSDFFSLDVSIIENDQTGFPDDLISPGPTVVSTATLQTVADWFDPMTLDEVRRRFRANIEVDGVEPFWEDRLFRADGQPQPFRVGGVLFGGVNSCQRCVVPTRDARTGEVMPLSFARRFAEKRQQTLPAWSPLEHFDHFYRLTTNTKLIELGTGIVRVGDQIEVLESL